MKILKIILLLLLCITIVACSNKNNEKLIEMNSNKEINIEDIKLFDQINIIYPVEINSIHILPDAELLKWENYIENLCKIRISLDYLYGNGIKINEYGISQNNDEINKNYNLDGFILISHPENYFRLLEANMLLPIDKYIKDIKNSNIITDKHKYSFITEEGLMALPTMMEYVYYPRLFDKELMEKYNFLVPETIQEFTDLAVNIRELGVKENQSMYIAAITSLKFNFEVDFLRIFTSFGCYPNIRDVPNISLNPESGVFEDMVLTKEFENAISYIKNLVDNDLLYFNPNIHGHEIYKNNTVFSGYILPDKDYEQCYYLIGDKDNYLIYEQLDAQALGILKDSTNIKEKIEFLINEVFLEKSMQKAFNMGIEDYNYEETPYYYIIKYQIESGINSFSSIPLNYINDTKPAFMDYLGLDENSSVFNKLFDMKNNQEIFVEEMKEINEKLFYEYSSYVSSSVALGNKTLIRDAWYELLENIFIDEISIEDAIKIYTDTSIEDNFDEIINAYNK